ncbi:MFS transporter [Microbacterium indicum]|uniref:MFS transporter n=1 Tax=Microbacterium indicum TaxID=358100 RepID=UPI00042181F9|nr:MFS transporter [Microbacterium indicum]
MPKSSSLRVAVWAVGCFAYLAAIMSRTSLSATGAIASDRFDLTSSDLALFGMLQLLVYAGAQIPVGMLIDRLGARAVLLTGVGIIAVTQLVIGFGDSFGVLLVARAFAGLGDAMVFPAAVRLTAVSLSQRWITTGTQMIGVIGNFGMVVTATPLVWLVGATSWPVAYLWTAAFSGVALLAAAVILVAAGPDPTRTAGGESLLSVLRGTGEALAHPGTWYGWVTHLSGASMTAFVVTWGALFLQHGAGVSTGGTGLFLSAIPIVGIIAGPAVGRMTADSPTARVWIVGGSFALQILAWVFALVWPSPVPVVPLTILAIALALAGPASLSAFDVARENVPPRLAARANGVVNTGGFSGALVIIWATGAVLTAQGAVTPDDYTMPMFAVAFVPMLVLLALGLAAFLWLHRRMSRRD